MTLTIVYSDSLVTILHNAMRVTHIFSKLPLIHCLSELKGFNLQIDKEKKFSIACSYSMTLFLLLVLFNVLCLGLTCVSSVPWVMSMCQEGGSGCHFCGCSPGLDYRYYLYYSFFTGIFGKPLDCLGRFIRLTLQ